LPPHANLSIQAVVGGSVSGRSVVSNSAGNQVNLVYGDGSARLEMQIGGDLSLRGDEGPRSSSSSSFGASGSWRDFEREMENIGVEIEREMSKLSGEIERNLSRRMKRLGEEQRHRAEELRQRSEHLRRQREQVPRVRVRINDREWSMDSNRLERIVEQARRAAQEGVFGALEAVEQALRNIHVSVSPTSPKPPTPPRPATPPSAPPAQSGEPMQSEQGGVAQSQSQSQGDSQTQSQSQYQARQEGQDRLEGLEDVEGIDKQSTNPEQEREAILRMIAEGRISPEEGDLLLEALG
jgi:hypothetical protein